MATVNDLELPPIIMDLIAAGRWKMPTNPALLGLFFRDFGSPCETSGPKLFLPPQMQFETNGILKQSPFWNGKANPINAPGDIDPARTVLIGDTGIGWDAPIALDYRKMPNSPSVLWLRWPQGNEPWPFCWIQISQTVQTFAETLKL